MPSSLALKSLEPCKACGSLPESKSNHVAKALGTTCRPSHGCLAVGVLSTPSFSQGWRRADSSAPVPTSFMKGPCPQAEPAWGWGDGTAGSAPKTSSLTPHRPQRFPLNQAFDIPVKEALFATAGSRGPAPPCSARKARDEPKPREERTESHRLLLGVALAGQPGGQDSLFLAGCADEEHGTQEATPG